MHLSDSNITYNDITRTIITIIIIIIVTVNI